MTVLPRRMQPGRIVAPGAMTTLASIWTARLSIITPLAMWLQQHVSRGLGSVQPRCIQGSGGNTMLQWIKSYLLRNGPRATDCGQKTRAVRRNCDKLNV